MEHNENNQQPNEQNFSDPQQNGQQQPTEQQQSIGQTQTNWQQQTHYPQQTPYSQQSPYTQQTPYTQQPPYAQQPPYGYYQQLEPIMSVKDWLLTLLVLLVPCVNIIMVFVWAFSNEPGKKSRSNYFKAYLIMMAIGIGIWILIAIIGAIAGFSLLNNIYSYSSY